MTIDHGRLFEPDKDIVQKIGLGPCLISLRSFIGIGVSVRDLEPAYDLLHTNTIDFTQYLEIFNVLPTASF